jgi:hypothetical protein
VQVNGLASTLLAGFFGLQAEPLCFFFRFTLIRLSFCGALFSQNGLDSIFVFFLKLNKLSGTLNERHIVELFLDMVRSLKKRTVQVNS